MYDINSMYTCINLLVPMLIEKKNFVLFELPDAFIVCKRIWLKYKIISFENAENENNSGKLWNEIVS